MGHDENVTAGAATPPNNGASPDTSNFSLVLGGPLFQWLCRAHLSDDELMMVKKRIIVMSFITWMPLLILAAVEGHLFRGDLAVPFLLDLEVHVRFLVAMPLLILSELVVHQRMQPLVLTFLERNLVPEAGLARFRAAIASAFRLRNSVFAETLLIGLVYGVGVLVIWRQYIALDADTWYATPSAEGSKLSLAGVWYGYLSLPMFQFLLMRWYFRLLIWIRFLWQVSRIRLSLIPTHPDRVGGLGFLSNTVYAFMSLAVAHGALLAGQLAGRIFFVGATLPDFKVQITLLVFFMVGLTCGPMLVFAPQLAQAKRIGLREYGTLAERYVREFDTKWLRGGAPPDEPLAGSADIQSLADMGNSFEVLQAMRRVPVNRDAVVQIVGATLVPIVPLALTMMSMEDLLKQLFGILF